MDGCFGYHVEILSLGTGECDGVPMAMVALRPYQDTFVGWLPLLFTQEQCVRLRDDLDNFLCDPESPLHLSLVQQAACNDWLPESEVWDQIVPLLKEFATIPEGTEETERIRRQLTRYKVVLAARLLFYSDEEWKLLAAAALARIDPDRAPVVLPTLIAGLRSASEEARRCAAVACRSLGSAALPAVDALSDLLRTEQVEAVRRAAEEALAGIEVH